MISTPFIVVLENAKPHYLEHTCLQNKEPGQFNLRCAASVVNQINFCKIKIKVFDEIVCYSATHFSLLGLFLSAKEENILERLAV